MTVQSNLGGTFTFANTPMTVKALRKTAGVHCRLHDLRHTAATKMAEAGVPESTMLALMGHMSRAMLERYSHIRMAAKRTAMDSLMLNRTPATESSQQTNLGVTLVC